MLPKPLKFLASLKLAVLILLALGVISAVGTFYESLYNAEYAKQVIYQSFWMIGIQVLLTVTLIAVMVDRFPWKKKHIPFLLAHVGIIVVQIGSVLTYFYGVDGVMVFPLGEKNRYVRVVQKEFAVYSSFDGSKFTTLFNEDVNYFKDHPKKNKIKYQVGANKVLVKDYYVFAEAKNQVLTSKNIEDGPAVRFFIEGVRAKESGWLIVNKIFKESRKKLGPAQVSLHLKKPKDYKGKNEIVFYPNKERLSYILFNTAGEKSGEISVGEILDTGWMDFKLRVLSYKPHAYEGTYFEKLDVPHALSTEALQVSFMGKDYWLGLNQPLKIFLKDRVYILSYAKKKVDIGFNIHLKDFKVMRYQGSMQAANYESVVSVGEKDILISMNQPMKKNGLTFYQSSFQEDKMRRPTHSVLSVNKDPGRFVKYFGCFLIVLGTIFLFWSKKLHYKWRLVK